MTFISHIVRVTSKCTKKLGGAAEQGNHAFDKLLPWRALAF